MVQKKILLALAMKAAHRLRNKVLYTGCVSISLCTTDGIRITRKSKISATHNVFSILHFVDLLWEELMHNIAQNAPHNDIRIKKISICLYKLSKETDLTKDLFIHTYKTSPSNKTLALSEALESLQNKYKKQVVALGMPPETATGYVGTKIAFSRIPEQQEFWY